MSSHYLSARMQKLLLYNAENVNTIFKVDLPLTRKGKEKGLGN